MKTLIVNRYMSVYGGAEQLIKELSQDLSRRGLVNKIISLNISDEVKKIAPIIDIVVPGCDFPYAFRSSSLISSLGILKEFYFLKKLTKKHYNDFDIINLHNFPASWAGAGLKKPVVWMCNEVPDFYNNPKPSGLVKALRALGIALDRYYVNKGVDIICVADELNKKAVFTRYGREAVVVAYGIDFPQDINLFFSQKPQIYEKYKISEEDFLILQVGVVSPAKNQQKSIEAFGKIKEKIPNAKLILAGNDKSDYADSLKKYVKAKGLEEEVAFTGFISKDEVWRLYSVCNLSLFPVKLQGGYLSVFEAVSFAIPVIVSPEMGASVLVRQEDLGIVSEDFSQNIETVYRHYAQYKEKAKIASRWVRSNLTWGKFTDKMLSIYERALKGERL
jgi:glycosyltransferase involved in cell wall biosynthesis